MKCRTFGKTGLQVSALGFGCMRLPLIGNDNTLIDEEMATEMIHRAIENGVNYFDTAYPYHAESFSTAGESEPFLGRALHAMWALRSAVSPTYSHHKRAGTCGRII